MKITIITAVYNASVHISDAIESVINQDYDDIEYIVVEGASTDNTLDVVKMYEDKITRIISEPDRGLYDALNKGIRVATGDYIGFVHSDDMLYDNHVISKVVQNIKNTGCDIFYGNGIYVSNDDINKVVRNWISGTYCKSKIKRGWLPLHPTMYISRNLYNENGLYNISYKIAGDTDLLIRYLYKHDFKVSYLNDYIIKMRMGGMSTSMRRTIDKWSEDVRVYRSHGLSAFCLIGKVAMKIPQFLSQKSFYSCFLSHIESLCMFWKKN